MLKLKVFIGFILVSGVAVGSLNFSELKPGQSAEQTEEISHQAYWTCDSVDAKQNLFSGWALSLDKAQEQALENCSSYTEEDGACLVMLDSCEQMELEL